MLIFFPSDFYTWTRDAALTMTWMIEAFVAGNNSLESHIQNFVISQAQLQQVPNPSGGPTTGGLGEPKFNVNLSAFTGPWGRPQGDGSALRAIALIAYGNYLIS